MFRCVVALGRLVFASCFFRSVLGVWFVVRTIGWGDCIALNRSFIVGRRFCLVSCSKIASRVMGASILNGDFGFYS